MCIPLTLLRRAMTVPLLLACAAAGAGLLIVVVAVTGPVSLCMRGRWRPVRLGSFFLCYLALEVAALAGAFLLWARSGSPSRRDAERYRELNFQLIEKSLGRLYRAARRLFGLQVDILPGRRATPEAAPGPSPGPVIVLGRHAGPGDSFLLIYGLLAYARRRPLIVLKHSLVLDPLIDVLVGRVPHCFVRPGGRAAEQITDLAARLGDRDALVLFPEGGNFTQNRRRHAIGRLRRRGKSEQAAKAARMRNVLPPRPAGVQTAVAAAPEADLVFVAHTGLDHLDSAAAVWRGIPLDRPLRATWWRVPARDIPTADDARTDWLFAQWAQIDHWIGSYRPAPATLGNSH